MYSQLEKCCNLIKFDLVFQLSQYISIALIIFIIGWNIIISIRANLKGNVLISEISNSKYDRKRYIKIYKKNLTTISDAMKSIDFIKTSDNLIDIDEIVDDLVEEENEYIDDIIQVCLFSRTIINLDERLNRSCIELCNYINQIMYDNEYINRIYYKNNKLISLTVEVCENESGYEIYESKFDNSNGNFGHHYLIPYNEELADNLSYHFNNLYSYGNIFIENVSIVDGYYNKYIILIGENNVNKQQSDIIQSINLNQITDLIKKIK
jgi:hypothetical protein